MANMKYFKFVMRGDVARLYPENFMQHNHPKTRLEALELVNRWNRLVADEAIRAGLSNAEVFYYLPPEEEKPRVCNAQLFGYERTSGGTPVPITCTRLFGHSRQHSDQRDGNPIDWDSSGPFRFIEGIMRVHL